MCRRFALSHAADPRHPDRRKAPAAATAFLQARPRSQVLAGWLPDRHTGGGRARWSVALIDTVDGSTRIVPGSGTGVVYPTLSWSASRGRLFFRAAHGLLKTYRPGERRARALPLRLPRSALNFMAG
jgi:hypothetical protein